MVGEGDDSQKDEHLSDPSPATNHLRVERRRLLRQLAAAWPRGLTGSLGLVSAPDTPEIPNRRTEFGSHLTPRS